MLYEISDEAKKWLLTFLARTPIKGAEAQVMVQLIQLLQQPIQQQTKSEDVPETKEE